MNVKIGVMSDMSSLYADIGGPGSVAAAKLAIAAFAKTNPNVKVELVTGDHQNKPDVGSNIANQWFDVDKVDMIIDIPNSGVALAVSQVAANKNKLFIVNHGSWNRTAAAGPIGYRIMLATVDGDKVTKYEPFAEGFLQGRLAWGRPVDLLEMPDGSLLVSDDTAGAVYRISYRK